LGQQLKGAWVMKYGEFLAAKAISARRSEQKVATAYFHGFLYDFQSRLVSWAIERGRAAIFADCGLGKTAMQLSWADIVSKSFGRPVLILAPLSVVSQTIEEASRFGIEATRDGQPGMITVTNYQRMDRLNASDYCGVVCDESSILKSYSGATRTAIIDFMRHVDYRLLCSATPSPNDFEELGNSVEALGIMRRVEMLATFFVHDGGDTGKWRLRGHGQRPFWEFVAGWARAIRRPSDVGFSDDRFVLPEMRVVSHVLNSKPLPGMLFASEAKTLDEQRAERRATIEDRCSKVAEIANADSSPFVAWCSLNDESRLLTSMIDGAIEVSGSMSDEEKEDAFDRFRKGAAKAIVTKPSMAAFGMNWQHCHRMSFFPSHSHEQFYQAVRRCWRFGQKMPVEVHIVTTESESAVIDNLKRKEKQSIELFDRIVENMGAAIRDAAVYCPLKKVEAPSWL
jgi:hypothetical protein